jgi:gluconate 2-dehydrogenase gamma chain
MANLVRYGSSTTFFAKFPGLGIEFITGGNLRFPNRLRRMRNTKKREPTVGTRFGRVFSRRSLLLSSAALLISTSSRSTAKIIAGALPWEPNGGNPPVAAKMGPWEFFTPDEGRAMEALADRIIPPDPQTPGGKDSGSAVFVDRQLAGGYGEQQGHYVRPPFIKGLKNQGAQTEGGPRKEYRDGLAALDKTCMAREGGKRFADLADDRKDAVLKDVEDGKLELEGVDGKSFFSLAIKDVQTGFLADPIYGGNRDMAAWKMIGYPGARYNYLDWVGRHNEPYPLPPVSMVGRAEWTSNKSGAR